MGMANHFNILALNPMNCMKREKAVKLKDEPPRSIGDQHATGEDQRNSSYEEAEPKQKWHTVVDVSGGESKLWYNKEQ